MSIAVDHHHRNQGLIMVGVSCSGYDNSSAALRIEGFHSFTSSSSSSPSSSSSIGMNSDASPSISLAAAAADGSAPDNETEAQSSFKDPFDTMDALHQALPLRRGISMHYSGKSKSFTSLGDAFSVLSARELAKPRKNLMISGTSSSSSSSSSYNSWLRSSGGGISKRTAGPGRKRVIT